MHGSCVYYVGSEAAISPDLNPVRFCPWCGSPKGVPTPELRGFSPLVLYFATEADKAEMVEAIKLAKPGMITKHI